MNNQSIEIVKGNILNVKADAIVLPANRHLKEGSGVSTAIFEAAGRKLLTEACGKIGICDEGKAVFTPGFDLKSDYIIHTVVPKWVDGNHNEYQRLCTAYLAALNIADILGCESISFPRLGSGNNGYDLNLAYEIAYQTIQQFEGNRLNLAYLVIFGDKISGLLSKKGIAYVQMPDEYIFRNAKRETKPPQKGFIDQALEFLGKKESWDMMLGIAERIVKIVLMVK